MANSFCCCHDLTIRWWGCIHIPGVGLPFGLIPHLLLPGLSLLQVVRCGRRVSVCAQQLPEVFDPHCRILAGQRGRWCSLTARGSIWCTRNESPTPSAAVASFMASSSYVNQSARAAALTSLLESAIIAGLAPVCLSSACFNMRCQVLSDIHGCLRSALILVAPPVSTMHRGVLLPAHFSPHQPSQYMFLPQLLLVLSRPRMLSLRS